jgi:aspartate beta-hydroxylase
LQAAVRVGGEDHAWQQGRCITFDDTFLHEAWNHSERTRVVVLLDVWNPYLTPVEIEVFSELVLAIRDFNVEARLADPMVDAGHG